MYFGVLLNKYVSIRQVSKIKILLLQGTEGSARGVKIV